MVCGVHMVLVNFSLKVVGTGDSYLAVLLAEVNNYIMTISNGFNKTAHRPISIVNEGLVKFTFSKLDWTLWPLEWAPWSSD